MAKNRKKLRGTRGDDELTGTRRKNLVYGMGGNDSISTEEGRYSVWGGEGERHLQHPQRRQGIHEDHGF